MSNAEIPRDILLASIETALDAQFGGLLVSYLATRNKLPEIANTEWYDEEKSRFENKANMKDLGGVLFSYSEFLAASSIQLLANAIEDTCEEKRGSDLDPALPGRRRRRADRLASFALAEGPG